MPAVIPPWPPSKRSYYVILRWDSDRPGVYLGHYFNWWRLAVGTRPKARFKRIDMHDPKAHRFFSEEGAKLTCNAMPDLVQQKDLLSIVELRDL